MAKIEGVYAREILDSRGVPTIECTLWTDTGGIIATSVPTGTSVGKYEALELRDNDPTHMLGKGVTQAVSNVNNVIGPAIIGMDPTNQEEIDKVIIDLDGTENKSKLGANATLAVSQAVLKAGALSTNLPLYYYVQQKFQLVSDLTIPSCIYTVINGGQHGADNLDLQEYQIVPASHISFPDSINMAVTLFQKLEEVLIMKGAIHSIGLVGGFTPNLYSNTDVFEILVETIKSSPYTFAQDLFFGIDVAAAHLFSNGKYTLKDRSQGYTSKEFLEYFKKMRDLYNVFYIEDPFQEDDLESWKKITEELGETTKIVGDSLLATNKNKVQDAIKQRHCNTILLKPNQVGTISETVSVAKIAREAGWQLVMSHRSGETNDDFIADFAVGVGAEYAKFGPTNRGERISKYNRLMQIFLELQQAQQGAPESTNKTKEEPMQSSNQPTDNTTTPVASETPMNTTATAAPASQNPAPVVADPEPSAPTAPAMTPTAPVVTPTASTDSTASTATPTDTTATSMAPDATSEAPATTTSASPATPTTSATTMTSATTTTPAAENPTPVVADPEPSAPTAPAMTPTTPVVTPTVDSTTPSVSSDTPPMVISENGEMQNPVAPASISDLPTIDPATTSMPIGLPENDAAEMPNPAIKPGAVSPSKPDVPAVPPEMAHPEPDPGADTAAALKPSVKLPDAN